MDATDAVPGDDEEGMALPVAPEPDEPEDDPAVPHVSPTREEGT